MPKKKKLVLDIEFEAMIDKAAVVEKLLDAETDRGCALIAGSALDEVLCGLLSAFFTNDSKICNSLLHKPNAPVSTFSARALLCRGIGLISDDLFQDIDTVRYIRNQAAHFDRPRRHGHDFSFQRQDIADRCRSIRSFPRDLLERFPPRKIFEIFVGMSTACLGEHAIIDKVLADNVGEKAARECMFELVPKMNLKGHIRKVFKKELFHKAEKREA